MPDLNQKSLEDWEVEMTRKFISRSIFRDFVEELKLDDKETDLKSTEDKQGLNMSPVNSPSNKVFMQYII